MVEQTRVEIEWSYWNEDHECSLHVWSNSNI